MKNTYKSILTLLKRHKSDIVFDIDALQRQADNHLFGLELRDTYGLNIDPKEINSTHYFRFNDYMSIGQWGEKYNRTISWSDDKRQPKGEYLLSICFPTGAYIFGGDYPQDFYRRFWDELKSYKPDYVDTVNSYLFFSLNNASDIFNQFNDILKKYRELNREDIKLRQIAKMKEDLAKLEANAL